MSFISVEFIVFFVIFVPLYFLLPSRWRVLHLLIISYIFYSFSRIEYVLLIAFSTLVDYFVGRQLGKTPTNNTLRRRLLLAMSIGINLGVLFIFKYFNFFSDSIVTVSQAFGFSTESVTHNLVLPVGISFYTFQSMAYTIDVYRRNIEVEENPVIFATYIAFFPQLVAGPIERAQNMLPQFYQYFVFDYDRVVSGLRLVLWGVFKKVVIADRLAVYVNGIYNNVDNFTGLPLIVATLFFTFQIYCDFSGYSDIAIGVARIMGFDLMENFRQPYFATSVRDFWRRWHISLSTWFRDYLYIPLGGNKVSFRRNLLNLMIVFMVSGLWHGANWTFFIWGTLHGFYIVVETLISRVIGGNRSYGIHVWIQRIVTFIFVVFAWIFFRSNSLNDALYIVSNLFDFSDGRTKLFQPLFDSVFDMRVEFLISWGLIVILMVADWLNMRMFIQEILTRSTILRWLLYYVAVIAIYVTLLSNHTEQQFIYFQF